MPVGHTMNPYAFPAGMKHAACRWYNLINWSGDYSEALKVCPLFLIVFGICLGQGGDEQPMQ
jgi:hypothetical protein